jgi:acyl carrier protein
MPTLNDLEKRVLPRSMRTEHFLSVRRRLKSSAVVIVLIAIACLTGQSASAATDSCFGKVATFLTDHLGVEAKAVTPSTRFIGDLVGDELDVVEIQMATEREFGVTIPDADAKSFVKVDDLVAYLRKHGCNSVAEGNWLVILGAWPPSEAYKTKERIALLSDNGIKAQVVKTDDYRNLTPGLLAVVWGPTSKERALERLESVKAVVADAFIKESR